MANLAILGHATRGKEVIEILEILGGINDKHCCGGFINNIYFINENGYIESCDKMCHLDYFQLSLEDFLEKYPYIVGDKVIYHDCVAVVTSMEWINNEVCYTVLHKGIIWQTTVFYLQPYKEPMEENTDKALASDLIRQDYSGKILGYKIPNGYEFDCIKNNEIILKPQQPKYPKTYEGCCKVLDIQSDWILTFNSSAFCDLCINKEFEYVCKLEAFRKLLICCDAYWKIAGEQMGLDKPWVPDWLNIEQDKYVLFTHNNVNCSNRYLLGHNVLAFPTEEMRDVFYDAFEELIKECKELL